MHSYSVMLNHFVCIITKLQKEKEKEQKNMKRDRGKIFNLFSITNDIINRPVRVRLGTAEVMLCHYS